MLTPFTYLGFTFVPTKGDPRPYAGLCAILEVAPDMLAQALQLPPGAHIDAIINQVAQPGMMLLRVRGAGWPTYLGDRIMHTKGTVTGGVIDWHLPPAPSCNDQVGAS
jgi:hypothetical protein